MAKILIIEDERRFAENLKCIIEVENHNCTIYHSADMVVENWQGLEGFDIIILDLMMMTTTSLKKEWFEENEKLETGEVLFYKIISDYPNKRLIVVTVLEAGTININPDDYPNVDVIHKPLNEAKINTLINFLNKGA